MPQRDASALRDALTSLQGEITLIRSAFGTADVGASCTDPHLNNREWCVVYLNDAWHRFCRCLVLSSALLEPRTLSGTVVPRVSGLGSERDVLARLRLLPGRPRPIYWEPRWHDAVASATAARFLAVANASQIVAALGSSPSPAADLNTIRNFIAHRNSDTAGKLRMVLAKYTVRPATGISSRSIVDALLSQATPNGRRFLEWCSQIERIALASVT